MRKLFLFLSFISVLSASEYMAKVEPIESVQIKSEVSGKVIFVDKTKEFSFVDKDTLLVKIDSKDEDIELDSLKETLSVQKEILDIRERNYKNKSKVKQLSIYDKNLEKLNMLDIKQSIVNTKKSLKSLENKKSKKVFFIKDRYINEIFVHSGEYIDVGAKLFDSYDFSKSKIVVYVKPKEIADIELKTIYINNQKSQYKIAHISKVRDSKRVSTFRVELQKTNEDIKTLSFGDIVSVEFKNEK